MTDMEAEYTRNREALHRAIAEHERSEMVNHPPHYTQLAGVECIDVTEQFNFCRGNAIKYLWRAGAKGDEIADLRKSIWYIEREIARLEREETS